jgi:hypothetical protein
MALAARWGALCVAVTFTACSEKEPTTPGNGDTGTPPTNEAPGTVTGSVLDTQGRPLADAEVQMAPSVTTGTPVTVHTGADGRYRVEGLPAVPFRAYAWKKVELNGQRYCLRIGGADASQYDTFTPSRAVVRNFRWQLTGPIRDYDGEFFGGTIGLSLRGNFTDGTAQLTFTPTSTLLDGSPASAFTRTLGTPLQPIEDVPVANYTVTGVITRNGVQSPLRVGLTPEAYYEDQTATAQLVFPPGANGTCGVRASGVNSVTLYVNSPN